MQFGLYEAVKNKESVISSFYGLNRTAAAAAGEMEDMENMSSAEFPCAAPGGARVKVCDTENVQAVCAPDVTDTAEITGFTGIADEKFLYNGAVKSGTVKLHTKYKWSIMRLGNLYVMNGYCDSPKKSVMYYYNIDTKVFAAAGTRTDNLIVTSGADSTGSYLATFRFGYDAVGSYSVTNAEGDEIKNSDFFKEYGSGSRAVGRDNIFESVFSVGDEVTISGFPTRLQNRGEVWYYHTSNEKVMPLASADYSLNNTVDTDLCAALDDVSRYAIVSAYVKSFKTTNASVLGNATHIHYIYFDLYDKNGNPTSFEDMNGGNYRHYCSGVTVSKRSRCFNHIAAHHGRIWGTAPTGNMIYASASDDIFSFTSNDINAGYAARLTSDSEGGFTAICEYGGDVIAFKEDSITVIGGTGVSNYNRYVITGIGCIDADSVAVTPSGVVFLAYKGFYCYSGGTPVCISQKLRMRYTAAVSGWDGEVYYTSALRSDGEYELLSCDFRYGLWHRIDGRRADGFFRFRGDMYISGENGIERMTEYEDGGVSWSFTTFRAIGGTLDNKAVNELWIRADVSDGAEFNVYTSADGDNFAYHGAYNKKGLNIFRVPVRAVSGGSYRIKLTGTGRVVIHEIELRFAEGGRRYKAMP